MPARGDNGPRSLPPSPAGFCTHPALMKPITVLLAEDHTIVREGLRMQLGVVPDIEIIGEARSGRQAVEKTVELRPAVVVMDIAMPQLNGLEATRQILKAAPATKVILLSAHSDDAYIERAIALGVAGYLVKQTAAHCLVTAIREAESGKKCFSPSVAKRLRDRGRGKGHFQTKIDERIGLLTSREMEVLQLIAESGANKQIASDLGISIKTVEKHRQHVMEKLGIHDAAGLTRYAIAAGIIESSIQKTVAK